MFKGGDNSSQYPLLKEWGDILPLPMICLKRVTQLSPGSLCSPNSISPAVLPLRDIMTITSFGNRLKALYKLQGVSSVPTRGLCQQGGTGEARVESHVRPRLSFHQPCSS